MKACNVRQWSSSGVPVTAFRGSKRFAVLKQTRRIS